jgi:hypothetical protein
MADVNQVVSSKSFKLCYLICSQPCELIGLTDNDNRRHSPISILNDDVLLNIFDLYRLADENEVATVFASSWHRQCWWYKLAHVCRLWRNLILESPRRFDLHLYCTNGVPVAKMLAHSPPLPLTICYHTDRELTAKDESGISLALSHRDRVHRIDVWKLPYAWTQVFVTVMRDQFPILERMYIDFRSMATVVLPETFQAPNLRHLKLWTASLPIGSPLLTTAAGLVTLSLMDIPASAYFPPSYLRTRLSLMVQLEKLSIGFVSPIPDRDVEREPSQALDMITLPNLRWFAFDGASTYLEGLVAWISTPSLSIVHVYLDVQPFYIIPRFLEFVQTSEDLTFSAVRVTFGALYVSLNAVPWKWDTPFLLRIKCGHLVSQVASAAQLFRKLSPVLSVVEQVTFSYEEHSRSSHNNVDRRQWRELLRPFTNAKSIHVQDELVGRIFLSLLPSGNGEPLLELLPNLEEVGYSGESDALEAFTAFLNERQVAGHPVTLRMVDRSVLEAQ